MAANSETSACEQHFASLEIPGFSRSQLLGTFGLAMYSRNDDLDWLANQSTTDGGDDKSIDFCLVDRDSGQAYVGQSYLAQKWGKLAAPASKASALSNGLTWLLQTRLSDVPQRLQPAAKELRDAIAEEEINRLHVLYIHNCHESDNVRKELESVALTAKALLESTVVQISCSELGVEQLEYLFDSLDREILVNDALTFAVDGYFEVAGDRWKAIVTTVRGDDLKRYKDKYGDDLTSANIRDYLGRLRKKGNVNSKIATTIAAEPESFWAYNNGITVLTNQYTVDGDTLTLHGMSIINGAQTTGVISDSQSSDAERVKVPCRIISCNEDSVIAKIVVYNNTQNAIQSFDLRSGDDVQRRLHSEFQECSVRYVHRRRALKGGLPGTGTIHVATVSQALCAFGGNLQLAIRNRSDIFEDDNSYAKVFPNTISCEHVYLIQCLMDSIDQYKKIVRENAEREGATDIAVQNNEIFGYSTTKLFIAYVLGRVASQLCGARVPDLTRWRCLRSLVRPDRGEVVTVWLEVIKRIFPQIAKFMGEEPGKVVRSTESARRVSDELAYYLEAFSEDYAPVLQALRTITVVS